MELEKVPITGLAERCRQETEKYFQKKKNNSCYCYVLFNKAFNENSDKALNFIYAIYRPLVISWIQGHPYRKKITSTEEELFFDSMSQFIFAIKQRSMKNFPSLSHILSYLHKCVHSVIITIWRKNSVYEQSFDENCSLTYEDRVDEKIILKQAWNRIEKILDNPKELLLAHLIFVQHLKPQKILKEYPRNWQDTNEIRVDCQRIKRKLQKDDVLGKILDGFFYQNE